MIATLGSTSDLLSVLTGSTGSLDVVVTYSDNNAGTVTPQSTQATAITTATTTTIASSPGSGVQRAIRGINIRNKHASTSMAVTVQQTVVATVIELFKVTLLAGYELVCVDGEGWQVYDTTGARIINIGVPLSRQVLTSGTAATYTTPPRVRSIDVACLGGGGAGGGCTGATSQTAAAGGGGSGGYGEKMIVAPAATYTYTVGAAGAAAAIGANAGGAGGDTTFSTITAKGGSGGAAMATGTILLSAAGGAGGVAGSGGDYNSPGAPGAQGLRLSTTGSASGAGGNSVLGPGAIGNANSQATGTSAVANTGGGGSGGATLNSATSVAGGAGGSGLIVVTEYY